MPILAGISRLAASSWGKYSVYVHSVLTVPFAALHLFELIVDALGARDSHLCPVDSAYPFGVGPSGSGFPESSLWAGWV